MRNPIDAFLLQKLEAKGLRYAREADRLALLRRVYLDVTGIPPSPAEIDAYLSDQSPDAYEKLVDRLLASPRYGERWGQHWLDLAGYSDSEGFGQDDGVRPYAWRYRDYVIRSLNADKPYDQFPHRADRRRRTVRRLEAAPRRPLRGDRRPPRRHRIPAHRARTPTDSNERGLIAERMNVLADEVEVLSCSVMGITVGCARCHNHKYDPIPQRDYYRLSAILQAAYDPYEWKGPSKRELDLATGTGAGSHRRKERAAPGGDQTNPAAAPRGGGTLP